MCLNGKTETQQCRSDRRTDTGESTAIGGTALVGISSSIHASTLAKRNGGGISATFFPWWRFWIFYLSHHNIIRLVMSDAERKINKLRFTRCIDCLPKKLFVILKTRKSKCSASKIIDVWYSLNSYGRMWEYLTLAFVGLSRSTLDQTKVIVIIRCAFYWTTLGFIARWTALINRWMILNSIERKEMRNQVFFSM